MPTKALLGASDFFWDILVPFSAGAGLATRQHELTSERLEEKLSNVISLSFLRHSKLLKPQATRGLWNRHHHRKLRGPLPSAGDGAIWRHWGAAKD